MEVARITARVYHSSIITPRGRFRIRARAYYRFFVHHGDPQNIALHFCSRIKGPFYSRSLSFYYIQEMPGDFERKARNILMVKKKDTWFHVAPKKTLCFFFMHTVDQSLERVFFMIHPLILSQKFYKATLFLQKYVFISRFWTFFRGKF